jgi:hypothetical protein
MPADAPLILTLRLDDASQTFFDRAREKWFPARLNFIRAHVTMFHHLPGAHLAGIRAHLAELCAARGPAPVAVTGLRSLGHGVAYRLDAPEMGALRSVLAARWRDHLTPQDRQPWRPHVTVQNKVPAHEARALLERLSKCFAPFTAEATGVAIWRYRGGPWESETVIPFSGLP